MDDRLRRPPVEREVEEEIAFHLEMRVRELVAEGMGEEEARAEAMRRLGDVERVKARMRTEGKRRDGRMERRRWWEETVQDLGFALRQLRRSRPSRRWRSSPWRSRSAPARPCSAW